MDPIEIARKIAILSHGVQRYGEKPYSFHLEMVADLVSQYGHHFFEKEITEKIAAAAWLHDALEDTKLERQSISDSLGEDIALLVEFVTDEPGSNRSERKAITLAKTRNHPHAVFLKLCDRLANIQSSQQDYPQKLAMYRSEHEAFRKALFRLGEFDLLWEVVEQELMGI